MTVLIRPVPTRVAGNRIVPFRQVQYTNKVRPVSLGDWKPPVPEPLPPAPLLGLGTLAALGLQAVAWTWGLFNSRPKTFQPDPTADVAPVSGTIPPEGNTTPGTLTITRSGGIQRYAANNCNIFVDTDTTGFTSSYTDVLSVSFSSTMSSLCPGRLEGRVVTITRTANRVVELLIGLNKPYGYIYNTDGWSFGWAGPSPAQIAPAGNSLPLPDGYEAPQIEPSSVPDAPAPLPLPLPLPSTVPSDPLQQPETLPAPSPLVPVTPGPAAPPIVQPGTPISPQQPKTPGSTGTTNGIVNAPARVPVPVTDPTAITPWPGAQPITGIGTSPAPTLVGIAQEVGRIERKLEVMNTPNAPGNLVNRFDLTDDLIRSVIEALFANGQGTTYTLDSPCEVDSEGNRLPGIVVQAPGDDTYLGVIRNRLDALAELLQVHKDLKQPNCRGADVPVGGEFVTVNFEQID